MLKLGEFDVCRRSNLIFVFFLNFSWWRAPEVLINWEHYDDKIDIWAVGCIMAGLILRKTIFNGRHHLDQLEKIFRVIGTAGLEIPPNCPSGQFNSFSFQTKPREIFSCQSLAHSY
jgi:serine/threonine protein kinase